MSYTIGGTAYPWTVSGIITSANITVIPSHANITAIELPMSVTEIADNTFSTYITTPTCPLLTSIIMPGVTKIGDSTFDGCSLLTSITMPIINTIGNYALASCTLLNLTNVNAPSIGRGAFFGCDAITSMNLPNLINLQTDTFNDCKGLMSVYMPSIITIGSSAFDGCSSLKNLHINSGVNITTDPSDVFGSSKLNDFFITTDNASVLSAKLNGLTTNTSNLTASRIRMEYNPTSKSAAGDMVLIHSPAINATEYSELLTLFTGLVPTSGLHKTIYDNLSGINTGLLLNAYNAHSELDAYYSSISFNLAPHYKSFNTYINTTSSFVPGTTTQPDTTELIMTFTNGTFSKRLVYKLNK